MSAMSADAVQPERPRSERLSQSGWTEEEDRLLAACVCRLDEDQKLKWKLVSSYLPHRKPSQCMHRWNKVLNPNLLKGAWLPAEDAKLREAVETYGLGSTWTRIASHVESRNGKQCRERYYNHLDPLHQHASLHAPRGQDLDGSSRQIRKQVVIYFAPATWKNTQLCQEPHVVFSSGKPI